MNLGLRDGLSPVLVIKQFRIVQAPPDGVYLYILGRPSGAMSFLMTKIGLDDQWRLEVQRDLLHLRKASLAGQTDTVIPMKSISTLSVSLAKPLWVLVAAVLVALPPLSSAIGALLRFQFGAAFFSLVLAAAVCAIGLSFYNAQKKLSISIPTIDGPSHMLSFKPSVIEGVKIDMQLAQRALEMVSSLVMTAHAVDALTAVDLKAADVGPDPAAVGARFCGQCGDPLDSSATDCPGCGVAVA